MRELAHDDQDEYPEDNAIVGKWPKGMRAYEGEKTGDDGESRDECDRQAERQQKRVSLQQHFVGLHDLIAGGREHRGNRQQKRELSGSRPIHAGQQSPNDRGAGPRDAGEHRNALCDADPPCLSKVNVIQPFRRPLSQPALDK